MKGQGYDFVLTAADYVFEFQSQGNQGTIVKVVWFERLSENSWNLAFGDKQADSALLDDLSVSNNGDLRMVMQTVANIALEFMSAQPGKLLFIQPIDERRKSLYNYIFSKKWPEIREKYQVFGISGNYFDNYQPEKVYDLFVLSLKPGNFEQ
jgi:hypothetical protein